MAEHWSTKWLGKPYAHLGRGPEAYDCLGLFLSVQAAEFGRDLPYGLVRIGGDGADEARALAEGADEWRKVDVARAGDLVLMTRGTGWHIGVALDDRRMLHATEPASAIEPFRVGKWGRRLFGRGAQGVYRFND